MRTHFPLVLLIVIAGCGGSSPLQTEVEDVATIDAKEDSSHPNLTVAEQKAVLLQLNNICGDTWCSGDWSWYFKKVSCKLDLGSCTWTVLIIPGVPVAKPVPVYWRSCKVTGVHSFADLVDTASSGYQSINWSYYEASSECVSKIEAKLPRYTPLP